METTPNNKLIAEFMGATQNKEMEYEMYGIIQTIKDEPTSKHFFFENEMLFDTDWNWLMEVVGKIENLGYDVTINYNICTITNGENEFQNEVGQKIYATYQTVIEFIKWYNLNN